MSEFVVAFALACASLFAAADTSNPYVRMGGILAAMVCTAWASLVVADWIGDGDDH